MSFTFNIFKMMTDQDIPPEGCFKASIHIGTPMVIPTSALHYDLLVTTLRGITTACCTK